MLRILLMGAALVVSAFASTVHAQSCAPFTDVAAGDPFCTDIQWMYNRGITLGCTATTYCPTQFVRRDQMAAFMNRLGNVVFQQGGNAFGATAVLGTNDAQALELRAGGARAARFEPVGISPNLIGGHPANAVSAGVRGATIAGGGVATGNTDPDFTLEAPNRVTAHYGVVGGGYANVTGTDDGNLSSGAFAVVAGGLRNVARWSATFIGGGSGNRVDANWGVVAGGSGNQVSTSALFAVVGGGSLNMASGGSSVVAGGLENVASGEGSVVPGGLSNVASGSRSLAAISQSEARGDYSIAIGRRAKTFVGGNNGHGAIVLADGQNFDFAESTDNRLAIRATGGMRFVTDIDAAGAPTRTMTLTPAGNLDVQGTVTSLSDRNAKVNLEPVVPDEILDRLAALPISTWSYRGDPSVQHVGPTAQDFRHAFRVGDSDRSIATVDADGVALAAIQALYQRIVEKDRRIAALESALEALERHVERLSQQR